MEHRPCGPVSPVRRRACVTVMADACSLCEDDARRIKPASRGGVTDRGIKPLQRRCVMLQPVYEEAGRINPP